MKESVLECKYWDIEIRDDKWAQFNDFRVPKEFSERKNALKEFHRIEGELKKMNIKGWIAGTAIDNYKMMLLFDGLGAQEYFCKGEDLVFYKEIDNEQNEEGGNPNPEPTT